MSLYWDRQLPQRSIFSTGCHARIQMRSEPSFAIVVSEPSPCNPDLRPGDVILAIGDVQAPLPHASSQHQQRVFCRSHSHPHSPIRCPIHFPPSFSSTLASLAAPVTVVIQRGQSAPREIRIKPDSCPHPEHVIQFFEGLGKAAGDQQPVNSDAAASAAASVAEPYASLLFVRGRV